MLGPVNKDSLDRVLRRIRKENAALVGLTANYERGLHLQSFFLAFKREALRAKVFHNFVNNIRCLSDKEDVINNYEIRLSPAFDVVGLTTISIFNPTSTINEPVYSWKRLLNIGFPFVKISVITGVDQGVDRSNWRDVLQRCGYDVTIANRMLGERVKLLSSKADSGLARFPPSVHCSFTEEMYRDWVRVHESQIINNRNEIIRSVQTLRFFSLFTIVILPDAENDAVIIDDFVKAIQSQIYPYWELILPHEMRSVVITDDNRICFLEYFNSSNHDCDTRCTVERAVRIALGDFIVPLPADARLTNDALLELVKRINKDYKADLLYGDEDRIDGSGKLSTPRFKTSWDPDLMLGYDALGTPVAYRMDLVKKISLRHRSAALVQRELSLRIAFSAAPQHIHHIPAILCHRLFSMEDSPSWDEEAARDLVRVHLAENGIDARVIAAPRMPAWNWIRHTLPKPSPLVSIIIPTRDRPDLLKCCVESILSETDYPNIEILIVDNNSRDPTAINLLSQLACADRVSVLSFPGPFNYSAMNNLAARRAHGQVLVLLNNDTVVIRRDWLHDMVGHALRPDVGAVGARLLYETGSVQHAGVVFSESGLVHQFRFSDMNDVGPSGELVLARSVSMVTGACLAVRRSLFLEVGGLDENLRIAFNDVDFCMRLGDLGYRNVWTPVAELVHFESVSRGADDTPEKQAISQYELAYFRARWGALIQEDPFFNRNIVQGWDSITLNS